MLVNGELNSTGQDGRSNLLGGVDMGTLEDTCLQTLLSEEPRLEELENWSGVRVVDM